MPVAAAVSGLRSTGASSDRKKVAPMGSFTVTVNSGLASVTLPISSVLA